MKRTVTEPATAARLLLAAATIDVLAVILKGEKCLASRLQLERSDTEYQLVSELPSVYVCRRAKVEFLCLQEMAK